MFQDRIGDRTRRTTSQRLFERGGVVPGGPDDGQRVRRPQRQRHQDQRRHPQPVAARPHGRRLVGRLGGGGGRRAREPRDRRRRRRLDPHPRRLHRPARHEGHLRPHPAQPARLHAPEHRRARQPRRARCATPPATTTCAPASHPYDPTSLPSPGGWEAGLGTQRPARPAGRRSSRTSAASTLEPGVEDRIRARGQGAHRRQPAWSRSTSASSRRTSPPSG